MLVPCYNGQGVAVQIAGTEIKIPPRSWEDVPVGVAFRHRGDPTLLFAWGTLIENALDWQEGKRHISILSPFNPYDGYGLVGIHAVTGLERRGYGVHISNEAMPFAPILRDKYPKVMEVWGKEQAFTKWGLCHIQPKNFPKIQAARKIAWTMFEATRLPRSWTEYFKVAQRLIVPTKGQIEIFRKSDVRIPIDVVPDGIDFDAFSYFDRPERKTFTFITWGRLSSRKCPNETAWAFTKAFPREQYPDVRMVFKTRDKHFGQGGGGMPLPRFQDDRITIINSEWELSRLVQFCHDADAAVFLSHGEGFGQPAVQAMATGLPVVLSNHSGQSDFSNERYNYPVGLDPKHPYVPSPLGADYGEPDQLEWWENDYDEAIERMREVYHNRDRARQKGKRASEWVRKHFSVDAMLDGLEKLIRRLE